MRMIDEDIRILLKKKNCWLIYFTHLSKIRWRSLDY